MKRSMGKLVTSRVALGTEPIKSKTNNLPNRKTIKDDDVFEWTVIFMART